jgi:maltooligosyltrehalose synthase
MVRENKYKVQTLWLKPQLVYSGMMFEFCSDVFDDRCHNEFRAICADIKEVIKTNSKVSAKQKD